MANFFPISKLGPAPVTGRYLAHNHLSRIGKAYLASDLHAGRRCLVAPTLVQAALLARIDRTAA